jgi:Amidohydrolase BAB2_0307-like, N-terminal domain
MYSMASLWFEAALLPSGWAHSVRLTGNAGRIGQLSADAQPQPGDERHAIALPGLPNVHSHALQRGLALAGLAGNFQSNARLLGSRDGQMRTLRRRRSRPRKLPLEVTDGDVMHFWIIGIEITQRFMVRMLHSSDKRRCEKARFSLHQGA